MVALQHVIQNAVLIRLARCAMGLKINQPPISNMRVWAQCPTSTENTEY